MHIYVSVDDLIRMDDAMHIIYLHLC